MHPVPTITPKELAALPGDQRPCLVDVRNLDELSICTLDYDAHIPLADLPERFHELDPRRQTVVYCRSGARSARAVEFLLQRGFVQVQNLEGGILRYGRELDPTMRAY